MVKRRGSFSVGCKVEVRRSDVWFTAVITKGIYKSSSDFYGVAYMTLDADECSRDPLLESVHCSFVRPRQPPPLKSQNQTFGIHQWVEAFHNKGWWKGVVTKEPEGDNATYAVRFPPGREEFRFETDNLRIPMEWVKRKWLKKKLAPLLTLEEEMDGVQESEEYEEDNSVIPLSISPTPDNSLLQVLETKYNNLLGKYQEQTTEIDKLQGEFEHLKKKCALECGPKYVDLKNKYTQECAERKRLHNEILELKGNIRVFCRCRPLSSEEISEGLTSVIEFDPSLDSELQVICSDDIKTQFIFDHVFSPNDNQEVVFAETLPVVKSVLDGYNVCIFAYGQTGTGKTFTMEGTPDNRGVNYRALEELFRSSIESSMVRYKFSVSILEVYNEKIIDLLAKNSDKPAKKLEVRHVPDGTLDVPGLVEAQVCNVDEVWQILKTGGKNRSVGSTNANEQSSRSHCLVRVTVNGENLLNGQCSRSHMWLVDLAGSERVGKTEVEGERLKEAQFINKSLSALGDVISAIVSKNSHIPYRNSKLTHLLQSSLGGDCKTVMFAQISPSSADLGETLCSLRFASRVRGVELGPARKQSDPTKSLKRKQKVGDLESRLDRKKTKAQSGSRDSAKYSKPPLAPISKRK